MRIKKQIDDSPIEGRVVLNSGSRHPGGHRFVIFVRSAIFYATITHAEYPELTETFIINAKKYPVLEQAVDARIEELKW